MKVLVFTRLFPHNIDPNFGSFIAKRMHAFAQRGHEVKVVAPVPYFPQWRWLRRFASWSQYSEILSEEERWGLSVVRPRFFIIPKIGMSLHGIFLFLSVLPRIYRLRKKFDFDLIDAHFVYPDSLAALWLGKIFHRPVVVSARGSDILLHSRFFLIRQWIRHVLKKATALIAVSGNLEEKMRSFNAQPECLHLIPNGIDIEAFYFIPMPEARQTCKIPENQKTILAVGMLEAVKNFAFLIETMKSLKDEHLYIIGKGSLRQQLQDLAKSYGLSERVHLVGAIPNHDLKDWYNAADLLCVSSISEGSPNIVYEALACGTPIVAHALPGICPVVDTEKKGMLLPTLDISSFVSAITKALYETTYNRQWIAQEGQKRTWQNVAESVEKVFEGILKK